MKILNLHIENFGKLNDLYLNLGEHYNRIVHENGWGKSTLISFIKVMLYGFEGENKRSEADRERLFYLPWQGGTYGGSMTFTAGDKTYELTRTFGRKADEDTFELRDADTDLVSSDFSSDIGKELFGIDSESFMRTVFVAQDALESKATGDINAKISNLTDDTNDINNYETADKLLKDALNSLSPARSTGLLSRMKRDITTLRTEVRAEDGIKDSLMRASEYISALIKQKEAAVKRQDNNASLLKKAGIKKELEAARSELEKNKALQEAEIKELEAKLIENDKQKSPLLIAGIVLASIDFVALIFSFFSELYIFDINLTYVAGALLILGIIVILIGAYLSSSMKKAGAVLINGELTRAKERHLAENIELENAISRYRIELGSDSESIPEIDYLTQEINNDAQELKRIESAIGSYKIQTESLTQSITDIEEKKLRLAALEEKFDAAAKKYAYIEKAKDYLSVAKDSLTSRYIDPVKEGFMKYYSIATGGNADRFFVDASANITFREFGQRRQVYSLSRGNRDLIWLCLRLAFADAMYTDEKPMLIMDDPFINLDDRNAEGAGNILAEVSKEYQIIYFSCR